MTTARVTIVGMGPRGMSILERMVELLHADPTSLDIQVDIVEPGECGQGSHPSDQSEHLLTNTVASQVSAFAHDSAAIGAKGLTFTQWARTAGYRKIGDRFLLADGRAGDEISDDDYLPRRMLGEYLTWAYSFILDLLPDNVRIRHHKRRAVDLSVLPEQRFLVTLDDGCQHVADYVFLATGHGRRAPTATDVEFASFVASAAGENPKLAFHPTPYPIRNLGTIASDAVVAVQGLGLTAYDVISALTAGRDGRFLQGSSGLRYEASGREPKILLFSRNCLPFAARGANQKGIAGRHRARFFTVDAVKALQAAARARADNPQLDFGGEVLPLIEKEMAYAYRAARIGHDPDAASFQPTVEERRAISGLLDPLEGRTFSSLDDFGTFFRALVEADLAEARRGNLTSPVKAATDVLRDTREALRTAVEFGGLTPASHRVYVETFVATTNRISFGPPRQRNAELLALMDVGILDVAGGPGNRITVDRDRSRFLITNSFGGETVEQTADALVVARLDPYSPEVDASPLTASMARRGIVRGYRNGDYHPGGLDIDHGMNVIGRGGRAHRNLWAVGFAVEGPHFYTHALPRPLMTSRFTQDAHRCVAQWLDLARRHLPAPNPARPPAEALGDVEPAFETGPRRDGEPAAPRPRRAAVDRLATSDAG